MSKILVNHLQIIISLLHSLINQATRLVINNIVVLNGEISIVILLSLGSSAFNFLERLQPYGLGLTCKDSTRQVDLIVWLL